MREESAITLARIRFMHLMNPIFDRVDCFSSLSLLNLTSSLT
uniref:Uncharacterized protein n=1 Tax=Arundo donax TaxID=35708 RepID=A0A0A9E993_ARUDO